jgi:hypothetical protein
MPRTSSALELKKLIAQLQSERAQHVSAIATIDQTFSELGISVSSAPVRTVRRGRPPGSKNKAKPAGRRTRGKFAVTGDDSILSFIKGKGKATTAEVNDHWSGEGRKGKADNALTRLVKARKLKRSKIKGERGSRYEVA